MKRTTDRALSYSPLSTLHSPLSRGISLLEVLISIFIISIGLLGVASLIPAGKMRLAEANKSDRTGACGRAALHEIKVRGMLYPTVWQPSHFYALGVVISANGHFFQCSVPGQSGGAAPTWTGATVPDGVATWRDIGTSAPAFAVDPLATSYGLRITTLGGARLPSVPQPNPFLFPLPRFSLDGGAATTALADQVFRWQDELTFDNQTNATARPRAIVRDNTGKVGAYPPLATEPALTQPLTPGNDGNFSWFFTASPAGQQGLYRVSAVVCYKRNLRLDAYGQPEGERTVDLDNTPPSYGFLGGGYGGGTVQLANTISISGNAVPLTSANFPVKQDQWVMLVGWDGSSGSRVPIACQWYRVVGVGTGMSPPYLSLDGPDWPVASVPNVTVVVIDGVTGVYGGTVKLQ